MSIYETTPEILFQNDGQAGGYLVTATVDEDGVWVNRVYHGVHQHEIERLLIRALEISMSTAGYITEGIHV